MIYLRFIFILLSTFFTLQTISAQHGASFPIPDTDLYNSSPYIRRGTANAGWASHTSVAFIKGNRMVSAFINRGNGPRGSGGNLQLICWDLVGINKINRRGDITAGKVIDVKIIKGLGDDVVVAVKTPQNQLKLIWYGVIFNGALVRKADIQLGRINRFEIIRTKRVSRGYDFVTVTQGDGNRLKIITWKLDYNQDAIVRKGNKEIGAILDVKVAQAKNFGGIYTAIKGSQGRLKVIPWNISEDGRNITRGRDQEAPRIQEVFSLESMKQGACVAVRDEQGETRIITFKSSSDGDIIKRQETLVWGRVRNLKLLSTPHGASSHLSAIIEGADDKLKLIALSMNPGGSNLQRLGSSAADRASFMDAAGVSRSYVNEDARDTIVTSFRDGSGNLRLITWDTAW